MEPWPEDVEPEIDKEEQMAVDLDAAQRARFAAAGRRESFWTTIELELQEEIKKLRTKSKTYSPDNFR